MVTQRSQPRDDDGTFETPDETRPTPEHSTKKVRERGNGRGNGGERGDRLRPANGADEVPPRRSTLSLKSYISPSDSRPTSHSAIATDQNVSLYYSSVVASYTQRPEGPEVSSKY